MIKKTLNNAAALFLRIKQAYVNIFTQRIFARTFFSFILIIFLVLIIFQVIVSYYINAALLNRYISYNTLTLEYVRTNFQMKSSVSERIHQMLYQSDIYNQPLFDYLENRSDTVVIDDPLYRANLTSLMNNISMNDSDIIGLVLYKAVTDTFLSYSRLSRQVEFLTDFVPKYPAVVNEEQEKVFFSIGRHDLTQYLGVTGNTTCYGIGYNLLSPNNYMFVGQVMFLYAVESLNSIIPDDVHEGSRIFILNDDRFIVYDSDEVGAGLFYDGDIGNSEPYYIDRQNQNLIITNRESDLIYLYITQMSEITQTSAWMNSMMLCLCILLIFIAAPLYYTQTLGFIIRINSIMAALKDMKAGKLQSRAKLYNKKDEIEQIAVSFNEAYDKLNEYINKSFVLELKQKNAQLNALQGKINHHLIYNTLEVIRIRAMADGSEDASDMIMNLAKLLRTLFKGDAATTIGDEIDSCALYIELFNVSYEEDLGFTNYVDNSVLKYGIPKNLFLPIVENYLFHGFNKNGNQNFININGYMENDKIIISFTDNGIGIELNKLENLQKQLREDNFNKPKNIGLVNVNDRIKLTFGKDYGICLESKINVGTTVTITMPPISADQVAKLLSSV